MNASAAPALSRHIPQTSEEQDPEDPRRSVPRASSPSLTSPNRLETDAIMIPQSCIEGNPRVSSPARCCERVDAQLHDVSIGVELAR